MKSVHLKLTTCCSKIYPVVLSFNTHYRILSNPQSQKIPSESIAQSQTFSSKRIPQSQNFQAKNYPKLAHIPVLPIVKYPPPQGDKLSWNEQYKSVKGKAAGGLASLRKLKNILPQSQLLNVYQALVESHLRYANVVWGPLSSTKLSTLQRYQDRAFDLIESSKIKDDYNKNILNVNQLMTFDRAVMTFKIVNQLYPESLQNKFIERSALSKYNTRNMKDLHVQKTKIRTYEKKFFVHWPKSRE